MDFRQFAFEFLKREIDSLHHFDCEYFSRVFSKVMDEGGPMLSDEAASVRIFSSVWDSDVVDYCAAAYPFGCFVGGIIEQRRAMGIDFYRMCVEWSVIGSK